MNSQKNCFQQDHGSINYGFPQNFGNHQGWNSGNCIQKHALEGGSIQQSFGHVVSSSSSLNRLESPATALYSDDQCAGIPICGSQVGNFNWCYPYPKPCTQIHSHPSLGENLCISAAEQNLCISAAEQPELNFVTPRSTLQLVEKPQLNGNQYQRPSQISSNVLSSSLLGDKLVPLQRNRLPCNSVNFGERNIRPSFDGNISSGVRGDAYNSQLPQLNFISPPERPSPKLYPGSVSITSGSSVSAGSMLSNKTRIRWTQDLLEKFVECVNRLGGAEKATPKAILKLMDTGGLTIFHVKSHLQKYRIAKYMPDSSEGKAEKRSHMKDVPQFEMKTSLQLREALHLQLDVQRRLHEQLEIQRNLQMRIEEQGKQLKMMFDEQQKANKSLLSSKNLDITSVGEPFDPEDVQISMAEDLGNSRFPSKIS